MRVTAQAVPGSDNPVLVGPTMFDAERQQYYYVAPTNKARLAPMDVLGPPHNLGPMCTDRGGMEVVTCTNATIATTCTADRPCDALGTRRPLLDWELTVVTAKRLVARVYPTFLSCVFSVQLELRGSLTADACPPSLPPSLPRVLRFSLLLPSSASAATSSRASRSPAP